MAFIVRLQTSSGVKRLLFPNDSVTWKDLQLQVMDITGVDVGSQVLTPGGRPPCKAKVSGAAESASLKSLKLQHGDMLKLEGAASRPATASIATPKPAVTVIRTFKPSERCQHGPRGRCLECEVGGEDDEMKMEKNTGKRTRYCLHGPGVTCLHCNVHAGDAKAEVAAWLCNHPDNVFCPKCIPPDEEAEEKNVVIKIDKIPYKLWIKEKQAACKYKHAASMTCANCTEPEAPSYAGKKYCNRGHKPWPYGVCLNCAPPNALVRPQPYRHCDNLVLQANLIQDFYRQWMLKDNRVQKAGILFGFYSDENDTTFFKEGSIRAIIQGLYEPPQDAQPGGVRLLKDPKEETVQAVATALGLEPVGWIITTRQREGEKYKGKVLMSGSEVRQASRFQERYRNAQGHSRFVTVVLEHGQNVEPLAYQVSDQCVALERERAFSKPSDPYMMCVRTPDAGEMVATIIAHDKPLKPAEEFLPDDFIVKVIASMPKKPNFIFKHDSFPCNGSERDVRSHLAKYSSEDYLSKLSDFNLLCVLADMFNTPLIKKVCNAIRDKQQLDQKTKEELDNYFVQKNFI